MRYVRRTDMSKRQSKKTIKERKPKIYLILTVAYKYSAHALVKWIQIWRI